MSLANLPIPFAPRGIPQGTKTSLVRYLMIGFSPHEIASMCRVGLTTVYRYAKNILMYSSVRSPCIRKLGRPRKLTIADEEAVLELLKTEGWRQQDEIVFWIYCERGVLVSRQTVSRILKRRNWTRKELRRIALGQNEELRQAWRDEMRMFSAEDIVFLDESIFNEKTGWRHRAYGPIGQDIRYPGDIHRGCTWAICAAMTVNGWLPCTGVKEGYYKTHDFLNWVQTGLIPALEQLNDGRARVIVLDNVSIHVNEVITNALEDAGYLVRFLPPYSPDFNPIELSFSVLKAWFRRNYIWTRALNGSFGDYLVWAIGESGCDRYAREQFRHAAGGLYLEEGERQKFYDWIVAWERGRLEEEQVKIRLEDIQAALKATEDIPEGITEG
jgi:transposase